MNIYCEFEKLSEFKQNNEKLLTKKHNKKLNTTITHVNISTQTQKKYLKKDKGFYTTIYCKEYDYLTNQDFNYISKVLKEEILFLIDKFKFKKPTNKLKYFVVGLGNKQITADSLGCKVIDKILCTTKDIENNNISSEYFGNAFSLAPSIASKTGIYTFNIIKSVCNELKPDIVILIDSLSCKNITYLGKTFQINTCGLTPGCEVYNKQPKISYKNLKTPVLAIGCPVVINLSNITNSHKINPVLTLKDIDIAIEKYAEVIAFSLNSIIHSNLSKNEIIFLTKK
ncbi:MAG: GPR endopeptidase [Clostridia bacterium]|nr:GPR endopeptidase [Clostridia bacterium]